MFGGNRRGGTRGGQAEFSWDQVKNDAQREKYLGHSLHASVGRWQKGKDIHWYNKEKADETEAGRAEAQEKRRQELREIKAREEEEMIKRLGGGPLPPSMTGSNAQIGSALASGSSRGGPGASSSTGANRSSLDPTRTRSWGKKDNTTGPEGSGSDSDSEAGRASGLSKEERRFARKVARDEARKARQEERERVREERRQRHKADDYSYERRRHSSRERGDRNGHRDPDDRRRGRRDSYSPPRRGHRDDTRSDEREQDRDKRHRSHRVDRYDEEQIRRRRRSSSRSRSRSPVTQRRQVYREDARRQDSNR